MDDFEKEMAANEAELAKLEAEMDQTSAELDRAFSEYHRTAVTESSSSEQPRRQMTPEEMQKGQEMLEKAGMFAAKSAATVVAVAGAGVVSLFKRDASPMSKTFEWCKKNWWD